MVGLISQLLWTIFRILFSGLYDLWLKKVNFTNSHNCVFLFQVLGSPSEETWPGISHSEELVNYNFPKYPSEALVKRAPRLDPDGIDLVSKFLLYEAKKRISAKDAIKHSYFDSLGQGVRKIADGKLEAYYFFSELPFLSWTEINSSRKLGTCLKIKLYFLSHYSSPIHLLGAWDSFVQGSGIPIICLSSQFWKIPTSKYAPLIQSDPNAKEPKY